MNLPDDLVLSIERSEALLNCDSVASFWPTRAGVGEDETT